MDVLIKILQFLLSFSLLVFIHELGHYLFARMFGIRVEKFYLFFNPWFSLVKFRIGETEFGIGWVPFGGYCKIAGMVDESMDTEALSQPPQPWEFRSKPAWQRLFVMIGGVLMNIVLALCIYIGMSYGYGEEYVANNDLKYGYTFNELGHEMGFEDGDRIVTINGRQYDDYSKVLIKMLIKSSLELEVLRDGHIIKLDIGKEFAGRKLADPDFMAPRFPFVIDSLDGGGGAIAAGMLPGDSLVAVNGEPLIFYDQYQNAFTELKGQTAEVTFVRDSSGVEVVKTVPAKISQEGKLGVFPKSILAYVPVTEKHYTFLQSIPAGIKRTGTEIVDYWDQIKLIFTPGTKAYKSLGGPISIGNIFPDTWNWYQFWRITGFLSIVLAIMNILPIPALDGGHVVFLLYEVISGRKPSDKFMEYAQMVGLILLFGLIIYATGNDIYRVFFKGT